MFPKRDEFVVGECVTLEGRLANKLLDESHTGTEQVELEVTSKELATDEPRKYRYEFHRKHNRDLMEEPLLAIRMRKWRKGEEYDYD